MLRRAEAGSVLAPFYDLVCTRIYPGIDRMAAMRIGESADPGVIGKRDWAAFAAAVGIGERLALTEFQRMAAALSDAFEQTAASFVAEYGKSPVVARIRKVIAAQVERSLRQLAERR